MPDDSFLWGEFRWNRASMPSRLSFVASGDLPALAQILELKQEVANDE